eukprot:1195852-Prorocentrum_minimum.AAC.3
MVTLSQETRTAVITNAVRNSPCVMSSTLSASWLKGATRRNDETNKAGGGTTIEIDLSPDTMSSSGINGTSPTKREPLQRRLYCRKRTMHILMDIAAATTLLLNIAIGGRHTVSYPQPNEIPVVKDELAKYPRVGGIRGPDDDPAGKRKKLAKRVRCLAPTAVSSRYIPGALLRLRSLLRVVHSVSTDWCSVVWCGVVWCGVVWCGVVRAASDGSHRGSDEDAQYKYYLL